MSTAAETAAEAEAGALPGTKGTSKADHAWIVAKHFTIFFLILVLWELGSRAGYIDDLLFPAPWGIIKQIVFIYFIQMNVWYHLYTTFAEALSGLFIGSLIGIGLATAAALSLRFREYIKPYIIVIEATPRIAVGPIFIAWLGFGFSSKVALASLVCFFGPFVNTLTGLLNIDAEAEELFRSMRATKWQTFWGLRVPNSATILMAGMKLGCASAFGGALVAEFVSANEGMGVLMSRYTYVLNMNGAFATLLSITLFAFLLFKFADAVDYYIVFWRSDKLMQRKSAKRKAAFLGSLG
jgi:NitT/TauT family transport system permease protein